MPKRKPILSPSHPIIKGAMAPPIIPVTIIPEKEPWCSLTEFKAKEKLWDIELKQKIPPWERQLWPWMKFQIMQLLN